MTFKNYNNLKKGARHFQKEGNC